MSLGYLKLTCPQTNIFSILEKYQTCRKFSSHTINAWISFPRIYQLLTFCHIKWKILLPPPSLLPGICAFPGFRLSVLSTPINFVDLTWELFDMPPSSSSPHSCSFCLKNNRIHWLLSISPLLPSSVLSHQHFFLGLLRLPSNYVPLALSLIHFYSE